MSMSKRLARVWNETTVTQTALAILVWGAIIYMIVQGQQVPDALLGAGGVILGYFFGMTNSQVIRKEG